MTFSLKLNLTFFLTFILINIFFQTQQSYNVRKLKFSFVFFNENIEKYPQKQDTLANLNDFFFTALTALTAQTSPKLQIHFGNLAIQLSLYVCDCPIIQVIIKKFRETWLTLYMLNMFRLVFSSSFCSFYFYVQTSI